MTTRTEERNQDAIIDRFIPAKPDIDYLAKDYLSFRQLMIDHLSVLAPNWQEESPADLGNVLLDLLAYAADYASYYQDAVASEAYLGTARLRHSVKRHARLLDYAMQEGCNARVWVHVRVKDDINLRQGTKLFTQTPGMAPILDEGDEATWREVIASQSQIFETMHDCQLYQAHNELLVYAVSPIENQSSKTTQPAEGWLRKGSTMAFLTQQQVDKSVGFTADGVQQLVGGDVLIFEEVRDPSSGLAQRKDPKRRHAVRLTKVIRQQMGSNSCLEIEWAMADALPFDLFVGQDRRAPFTVARGNIVLADHGRWVHHEQLPAVPTSGLYRPALLVPGLTHRAYYDHQIARSQAVGDTIHQDPKWTLPILRVFQSVKLPTQITLSPNALLPLRYRDGVATNPDGSKTGRREWTLQRDLLNSTPFAPDYIVEMEEDRRAYLRFGFDGMGKAPARGDSFTADYRVGNGAIGNIGADTIGHIVVVTGLKEKIESVRNPLPAQGGSEPERLTEVRLYAPEAFQVESERCVTEADYGLRAERFADVARAVARIRSIGSWQTVLIFVQRKENRPLDPHFRAELADSFDKYRYVGHDVAIRSPQFVPLEIVLRVYYQPGTQPGTLRQALKDRFSNGVRSNDELGFFHPDNLGFGQSVYQSQVVATAMTVPGVVRVKVTKFGRQGSAAPVAEIQLDALEIAEVENDSNKQHGTIDFEINQQVTYEQR